MKKRIFQVLLTIVILLLVYNIVKDVDFFEVYLILREINFIYVSLAFFASLLGFLLWNLRFKNSLNVLMPVRYFKLLPVLFAGLFVSMITPGSGVGGEPVRAYFLSKQYRKPKTKILGCIFADKFFNLFVFVSFVILSLLFVLIYMDIPQNTKIILEGILFFIFFLVVLFLYSFF